MTLGNATYIVEKSSAQSLKAAGKVAQSPAMLDYVLVSNRWRTSVVSTTVKWGTTTYRHGYKFDHGKAVGRNRDRRRSEKNCGQW